MDTLDGSYGGNSNNAHKFTVAPPGADALLAARQEPPGPLAAAMAGPSSRLDAKASHHFRYPPPPQHRRTHDEVVERGARLRRASSST